MTSSSQVTDAASHPGPDLDLGSSEDLLNLAALVCQVPIATIVGKGKDAADSLGRCKVTSATIPLTVAGQMVGHLVIADEVQRPLTSRQLDALETVTRQIIIRLEQTRLDQPLATVAADRYAAEDALRESEARSRAFIDHSPAVAFMKDCYGRYVYVNKLLCERFGRPEEEWLGRTDFDLFPKEAADAFWETDCRILSGDRTVSVMETLPTFDNSGFHWQSFKFSFTDETGARFLAGIAVDRTLEKAAEDALKRSEAKLRATIDHLAEGVVLVDAASGRIIEANAAVAEMFCCPRAELTTYRLLDLEVPGVDTAEVRQRLNSELLQVGRCDLGRRRFRSMGGRVFPAEVRVTAIPGDHHGVQAFVVRDLTNQVAYENRMLQYQADLESANARLRQISITDPLTGVKNRALFDERVVEEFDRALRYGRPLSLVLLDVDHFKQFNDTFGHLAGDETLRAVAASVSATARSCDVVARYGGEEFALILPDADQDGAMVLAERCRRAVATGPWTRRPVAVSVGVATLTPDHVNAWHLVEDADEALYRSKARGRNCVTHVSAGASELACV